MSASTMKTFGNLLPSQTKVGIGIDQSLTGFAMSAVSIEDPTQHHTVVFKSAFRGVIRLHDIYLALKVFIELYDVQDVAMEGTVLASQSALVLGELSATVKLCLYTEFNLAPLQVPPMTLKKFASGKGNSKKQEMLLQIYKRYGMEFNDDNAADAYGLGRIAGKVAINSVEEAILIQLEDEKYRDNVLM
jgi:Holliday junction resolvasome RuvABC endonuclease subunit